MGYKKKGANSRAKVKQILFLTFLLFYLLSLGNVMVPIYTLMTHKAKPLTRLIPLSRGPDLDHVSNLLDISTWMSHGLDDQGWVSYSLISLEFLLYQSSLSTLNKMITFV